MIETITVRNLQNCQKGVELWTALGKGRRSSFIQRNVWQSAAERCWGSFLEVSRRMFLAAVQWQCRSIKKVNQTELIQSPVSRLTMPKGRGILSKTNGWLTVLPLAIWLATASCAWPQPAEQPDRRPIVAILGYKGGYDGVGPVMKPVEYSILKSLKQIKNVHILSDVVAATQEAGLDDGRNADMSQAIKIGLTAQADFVIFGNGQYDGRTWEIETKIINVKTGVLEKKVVNSSQWSELQQKVTESILQGLEIKPEPSELKHMSTIWGGSEAELRKFCNILQTLAQNDIGLAQSNLQSMVETCPTFSDAFSKLAIIYRDKGQFDEAEELAREAVTLAPDSSYAHRMFAAILAAESKYNQAVDQYLVACKLDPDDPQTGLELGDIYIHENQIALAIEQYQKALQANPHGRDAEVLADRLAFCSPRLTRHYITNAPPVNYNEATLLRRLNELLKTNELSAIENPLLSDSEMNQFARQLTAGATNDFEKAERVYVTVAQLVGNPSNLDVSRQLTARKIFAQRNQLKNRILCQAATYLYISLVRAAGVRAYYADVFVACDGRKGGHCCAAIYADNKALLVDPVYFWFGVPHRKFRILDDLEVVALHLAINRSDSLEQLEVAAKIAPNLVEIQFGLGWVLLFTNDLAGAKEALAQVERFDETGACSNGLEGMIALVGGDVDRAAMMLENAVRIDGDRCIFYAELGDTYANKGDFVAAREAYKKALDLPHLQGFTDAINRNIAMINNYERVAHKKLSRQPQP